MKGLLVLILYLIERISDLCVNINFKLIGLLAGCDINAGIFCKVFEKKNYLSESDSFVFALYN